MKRSINAALLVFVLVGAGIPAWAHHSFAASYDMSQTFTIQGTLYEVRLTNPHSWFFVDVKDPASGKVERWSFEAGTPSGMLRNGFKASEVKSGNVVTVKAYHARDVSAKAGMLQQLTTAEGKVFTLYGPQEAAAGR